MKDDLKYIDEFYKNALNTYSEASSDHNWSKLKWILFWLRYRWLIISSGVLVSALLISLPFFWFANNNITETNSNKVAAVSPSQQAVKNPVSAGAEFNREESNDENIEQTTNQLTNTDISEQNVDASNLPSRQSGNSLATTNNELQNETNDLISEQTFSDNNLVYLSNIQQLNSLFYNFELSHLPDSLLIGTNRNKKLSQPAIKNSWFSYSLSAGPNYNVSSLSGNNTEYLNIRNNNEKNAGAWSLDADVHYHYKNFVITTGLHYSVVQQKRLYSKTYEEYSPEDSYYKYDTTWVYVYDPPYFGQAVVSSIDSSWVEVYNEFTIDNSGYNRLEYFEIPLMIGYQHRLSLFTIEANAGASFGFLNHSIIKVPSLENFDEITEAKQINNNMINFMANIKLYYQLNRTTSVFVSPYFKQNLKSVNKSSYPIDQRFAVYGLNFGVNITF